MDGRLNDSVSAYLFRGRNAGELASRNAVAQERAASGRGQALSVISVGGTSAFGIWWAGISRSAQ